MAKCYNCGVEIPDSDKTKLCDRCKKILLPFYWLRRIFRGMFNKNSKFYSENRLKSTINQEKIDSVKSLNDALGFKDKNIRY